MQEATEPGRIEINGFEIGNGHVRAQLAVMDAMEKLIRIKDGERDGIVSESLNLSAEDLRVSKIVEWMDKVMGAGYKNPGIMVGVTNSDLMKNVGNRWVAKLLAVVVRIGDHGELDRKHPAKLRVAVHPHAATSTGRAAMHIVLDAYADIYFTDHQEAVTLVPDIKTGQRCKELGVKNVVVVGPIVPASVVEARGKFETRKDELARGKGLRVMISTGGNMTHGKEIVGLTRAYLKAITDGANVEKVYIMVSQSKEMKDEIDAILQLQPKETRNKFEVVYDEDRIKVIRAADLVMGKADVIHGKTAEMVYSVGGGKVFETFSRVQGASLAVQEVNDREYAEGMAVIIDEDGKKISALSEGMANYEKEVEKILWQLQRGMLVKRMEAGLKVPVDGANIAANMAYNILKGDLSEKFRRKTLRDKLVEVAGKLGLKGRVLKPADKKMGTAESEI